MESTIDTLNLNIDNVTNLPKLPQFDLDYSSLGLSGTSAFLVFLTVFVIVVYLMFFLSSPKQTDISQTSTPLLETILIILFIGLISLNALKYFFNIDIKASLSNIFSKEPALDIKINKTDGSYVTDMGLSDAIQNGYGDEVFHISDNIYTYEDAKGICGAFGGRLANYFDIENAYKKGGEWCSYGWSDDQMVFFPTQKSTYDKLKKEGRQNDCGRVGVNGGFIGNPSARFGVNCVGKKPKITPEQQQLMYEMKIAPQTTKEDKKTAYWKEQKDKINVAPFNLSRWNM